MFRRNVNMGAAEGPLQLRPEALQRVHVARAAREFVLLVADGVVNKASGAYPVGSASYNIL